MDAPIQTSSNSEGVTHIRLACQACQRKKIKCDRTFPCGQCQRSSLQCVPSTRKSRVRQQVDKRTLDSELRSRISKLENLVESLSSEVGAQGTPDGQINKASVPEATTEDQSSSPLSTKYIGGAFWTSLTNEVQALRDALEEDESEEESTPPSLNANGGGDARSVDHDILICGPGSVYILTGALPEPSTHMANQLYKLYLDNIEPVFKFLHRPTVEPFLYHGKPYLGLPADAPPNRALRAAMWFAAVTSLRPEDCLVRFSTPRSDLLQQFRRHCDVTLTQADLINTTDIATLQAFVAYTAASRLTDSSRRPWTMIGLIMRIAQGMGLHHENASHSPYEKETRRRLWYEIRVLDAFAAADRGTEVLIPLSSFTTPPPNNVNDSEYDESSTVIPHREKGMSDMTFSLMGFAATTLTMRFLTPENGEGKGDTWKQRLNLALNLGKELREKYLRFCDLTDPFQRFIYAVGNSMAASSALRAVRPMQRHTSSIPPRVDSAFVLQLAVKSLRESEATHQDPAALGWRWIIWVQWHALAVALAGLCSIRDTELANTAWMFVDKAYDRHARQVADSRSGMLWKPIEKLHKKALAFRDGTSLSSSSQKSGVSPPQDPETSMSNLSIKVARDPQGQALPGAPLQSTQVRFPTGAMPMDVPMDTDFTVPISGADMTWMGWERIMEDISSLPPDMPLDDLSLHPMPTGFNMGDMYPPPPNTQGDWPGPLHQNLI